MSGQAGDGAPATTRGDAPVSQSRDLTGYGLVAGCFVLVGLSGALVSWADAPASVLLVLRLVIAAAILSLVFARRRPFRVFLRRDLWPRLLLMGPLDAGSLLCYFFAIRVTGVAVATFFLFMQPVWVALLAPHLLKTATERVVYLSLGVALVGLGVIVLPSLVGSGATFSAVGVTVGLASGIFYAFFQLLVKSLTNELQSTTIVTVECTLDAIVILPLALWQVFAVGTTLTGHDLVAAAILGLVCTAIAYTMWVEGVARIRVQHSSILGFLTPVVAPVFAWVLLGESITLATAVGGSLIVAAGVLVVLFGRAEGELEPL
jgi:drug/metabolite transporter (DMT)-like permease